MRLGTWWCHQMDSETFSKGNIFRVTGSLCGEFTGHRWNPLTKASDAEFWCLFWSAPWRNGGVNTREAIGIDTKIEVIVVSPTTWEAHHSPRVKPSGCGELPRSLVTPQWPQSSYQFPFYHDASKYIKSQQIRVCISRKLLIKLLQISHYGKHGHIPLSQQLP